jgi:LytS/YehU family sensor histidine kinase
MLPFIENAFKHGVSNQLSDGWVRIDILMQEDMLVLKVENSKNTILPEQKSVSGIGLQNVQKRLELIYPGRYSLQLMNEDETYLAILKITLTETELQKKITIPSQLLVV